MTDSPTKFLSNNNNNNINSTDVGRDGALFILERKKKSSFLSLVPINRFRVESVDNPNTSHENEKKLRSSYVKFAQHSINTINELPERSLDDER